MRCELTSQYLNFRLKTVALWQNVTDEALLQTQNFSPCTTKLLNFFPQNSPLPKTSETYSLPQSNLLQSYLYNKDKWQGFAKFSGDNFSYVSTPPSINWTLFTLT
jgi:hypothetical protein